MSPWINSSAMARDSAFSLAAPAGAVVSPDATSWNVCCPTDSTKKSLRNAPSCAQA